MQVSLSANLSNLAGETNAKSAEVAEAGAANGFFAQMGQIINQGNENNKAHVDPAPSVPASNSAEKNARRLLQCTSLLLPQALTVEQAPVQNVSGALSQLFHGSDDAGTEVQDAGAPQSIAGKSGGIALASGMESISMSNDEKGIADHHPSFQVPGDSGLTGGTPQPVIASDSENDSELHSPVRQAGSRTSFLGRKRMATGMADRGSLEDPPRNIKEAGINSEGHAEYPTKPTGDAIQNFQMLDLQKENSQQLGWTIAAEAAGTENDLVVSRNSMRQIEDLRAALREGLENTSPSVSRHARAGDETDMPEVPQDQALSAQLNLDFMVAGTATSSRGIPGQPAGIAERQDRSLADNFTLSKNAESQIDDSPVVILRKSLKTMPASPENSDTATASAAQGQMVDKSRLWLTAQGKLEQEQLRSGQQQFSAAERQPQIQSVFASSPAKYGDLTDSVSAPPAQSSTSHEPELYFQLADQIRIQLRDGKGEIRIQLKPDSLGRLEIRAENTAHGVSARISTDSGAVKSYLENNLQLLQQTLQDQGLKIDRIHIVVQDGFDSQSSSGYTAQFGHAGSGQNGKEPQLSSGKSSASHMNPIDETDLDPASWLALNPSSSFYTVA
jgi:flagellar hook-length control protein FliK